ncbi:cell division protein ZapA [Ilyomonas limi]|uniref:Cell division protein ZapA n=1 Tax=Ilyomonas limi TaxID=2575867 RepID=A0A4U3LAM7_9BACT|nr:cell division protein ZapA [Ilyomonas limi]TKK70837.1 cell division protein ZapA [Ilyomonas limi]
MNDLIPVNVTIADRTYRVRLSPDDEEVVRSSVKLINDKIAEFKLLYAGKDAQDYISMVLLWFATEQTKPGNNTVAATEDTIKKLHHIEDSLDKLLQE